MVWMHILADKHSDIREKNGIKKEVMDAPVWARFYVLADG